MFIKSPENVNLLREHVLKDVTVVQLQLGWFSSLSEWLDGALPNLHDVLQLRDVLR